MSAHEEWDYKAIADKNKFHGVVFRTTTNGRPERMVCGHDHETEHAASECARTKARNMRARVRVLQQEKLL